MKTGETLREYKDFFKSIHGVVTSGMGSSFFKGQNENNEAPAADAQIEPPWDTLVSPWSNNLKMRAGIKLYRSLRATIPMMDVIPLRWIGLIGDLYPCIENAEDGDPAQAFLDDFYHNVKVNSFGRGWPEYQYQMTNAGLGDGMGLGEAIPLESMTGIGSLKVGDSSTIAFKTDGDEVVLGQMKRKQFMPIAFGDDQWIHYYAPDQRNGYPQGYSIFHGMDFVAQILTRLLKSVDNSAWRIGDPSFITTVIGPEGNKDTQGIKKVIDAIGVQTKRIFKARRRGKPGDLFAGLPAGGEIKVDMIGAGGEKILSSIKIPIELITDQIIAKAMLPHWMLGQRRSQGMNSNLSDAERDVLNAQVKIYRRPMESIALKVFNQVLIMGGFPGRELKIKWDGAALIDEKTQSEANRNNAVAYKASVEAALLLVESGAVQTEEELQQLFSDLGIKSLTEQEVYTILTKGARERITK